MAKEIMLRAHARMETLLQQMIAIWSEAEGRIQRVEARAEREQKEFEERVRRRREAMLQEGPKMEMDSDIELLDVKVTPLPSQPSPPSSP